MFCGQCGKRVMENMLFCPFCGSPIVIPDQGGEAPAAAEDVREVAPAGTAGGGQETAGPERAKERETPAEIPPEAENRRPFSLFSDADLPEEASVPAEEFEPLSFDFDAPAGAPAEPEPVPEPPKREIVDIPEEIPQPRRTVPEQDAPPRRTAPEIEPRPERASGRAYIPPRDVDVENLFMDAPERQKRGGGYGERDAYDDDDYDFDPEDDYDSGYGGKSYRFVEEEEGSFFSRHVRGIVALILLAVAAVVLTLWSFSNAGQTTLARMNLAWKAPVYSSLADEAYKKGSKLEAAQYYEKAFARKPDNYEYAHSSMVAYYESGEIEKAAAMLKKCIAMHPNDVEPYREMLVLYPDAASRPWEITEIVRDGYSRTGDERLNVG